MTRFLRSVAASVGVAALLLTSGCGSDDEAPADGAVAGAQEDKSAKSPTPSPSPTPDSDQPKIELPDGIELAFVDWTSANADEQAVLDAAAQRQRATYAAIGQSPPDPEFEYIAYYNMTTALTTAQELVGQFKTEDATVVGTFRFTHPQVKVQNDGLTATLHFCADEREAEQQNRETGKVLVESDPYDFVRYSTVLQKNEQGVWQTATVESQRDACDEEGMSE